MRLGVVGTGSAGRRHIGHLLALGCEVTAMDLAAESRVKAKEQFPTVKVKDFISFRGLDALVIATPWDRHLPWVEECIKARLPFFVEKPLGSLEQLPRWREIAALDLPVNQVGYQLRFHPDVTWLKESIPHPEYVSLSVDWDGRKYVDGLLESSHEIDLLRWLVGDVTVNWSAHLANRQFCVVFAEKHSVYINSESARYLRVWTVRGGGGRTALQVFHSPEELGQSMYLEQLIHFLYRVQGADPGIGATVADGLKVLEVCHDARHHSSAPVQFTVAR